jgi:hypothetical protein
LRAFLPLAFLVIIHSKSANMNKVRIPKIRT